jgi:hypothetical protein
MQAQRSICKSKDPYFADAFRAAARRSLPSLKKPQASARRHPEALTSAI